MPLPDDFWDDDPELRPKATQPYSGWAAVLSVKPRMVFPPLSKIVSDPETRTIAMTYTPQLSPTGYQGIVSLDYKAMEQRILTQIKTQDGKETVELLAAGTGC